MMQSGGFIGCGGDRPVHLLICLTFCLHGSKLTLVSRQVHYGEPVRYKILSGLRGDGKKTIR
jgi:hypothetical protein